MDIAKAFTFVTEDERWQSKIGMGALISLLSFLIFPAFLLGGYLVGTTRNVMNGEERPLPEWEDMGQLFRDGLAVFLAQIVYTLPFWVLACIALVSAVSFGSISDISASTAEAGILATFGLVGCLALIFALALLFLSPAIVIQYVRTDELAACFRFGEIVDIARQNMGDILIVTLVSFVAGIVASTVIGSITAIPCLGWVIGPVLALAVSPWLSVVTGHMYGQIAAGKAAKFL